MKKIFIIYYEFENKTWVPWDMELEDGIWNSKMGYEFEHGIWDMGYGIWNMGFLHTTSMKKFLEIVYGLLWSPSTHLKKST